MMTFLKFVCVSSCIGSLIPLVALSDLVELNDSLSLGARDASLAEDWAAHPSHQETHLFGDNLVSPKYKSKIMIHAFPAYRFSAWTINAFRDVTHSIHHSAVPPSVSSLSTSSLDEGRLTWDTSRGHRVEETSWMPPAMVDETSQNPSFTLLSEARNNEDLAIQVSLHSPESLVAIKSLKGPADIAVDVELTSPDHAGASLDHTLFALNRPGKESYSPSSLEFCGLAAAHSKEAAANSENLGEDDGNDEPADSIANQRAIAQVKVNGYVVAEFPHQGQAHHFAESIKDIVASNDFRPSTLMPYMQGDTAIIDSEGGQLLIPASAGGIAGHGLDLLAIAWTNNLRVTLGVKPLSMGEAQAHLQSLEANGRAVKGIASWYGPYFHGRLTASGERFNQNELTAAHPSLPFGTYLNVTNLENGRSVVIRINDRGPYMGRRSLDLSRGAARCLDSEESGVVPYVATFLEKDSTMIAAW